MILIDRIDAQLPEWRDRVSKLVNNYGHIKVSDVTVEQLYSGIRGVQIQVNDISYVDPVKGIRLRGYTIPEVLKILPKTVGSQYPMAGGLYYLLMVNEIPSIEQALEVENEWREFANIPDYIIRILKSYPEDTHPMTLFSSAVLAMQRESVFAKKYREGSISKTDYWKFYLEDSMRLTAKLPAIAAFIYNYRFNGKQRIDPDSNLDWSANFAQMIGKGDDSEYKELCRLFFVLHSDHEGGNVSAHTSHLVASALSDVYFSCSAGLNGLAGPLHGLANQECLRWLLNVRDTFNGIPTHEQLADYVHKTLNDGLIIPGYGHAVLRVTDPRFIAQLEFGEKYCPDDELFSLVKMAYEVVPGILVNTGRAKNPWPNVDAINGTMQYHYGVREFDFYTVLFGVSRILGLTTNNVWARALGQPIERPKSLTTKMLEEIIPLSYYLVR